MQAFLVICAICLQLNNLSNHSPESLQQRDTACNQCITGLNTGIQIEMTEKPNECMMKMEPPSNIHTVNIQPMEERIRNLNEELKGLNVLLLDRDHEINELRQRVEDEDFVRKENDRLTRLLTETLSEVEELRGKAYLASDIEVQTRAALDEEYRRSWDTQMSDVNRRLAEERQSHDQTTDNLLHKIHELAERVAVLTADNERLTIANNEYHQDIESWQMKYDQVQENRFDEINQVKRECLESSTRVNVETTVEKERKFVERINHLNLVIAELQERLEHTHQESENLRNKHHQEMNEIIYDKEQKIYLYNEELKRLHDLLVDRDRGVDELRQKVADIDFVGQENDRLARHLTEMFKEVEELRAKASLVSTIEVQTTPRDILRSEDILERGEFLMSDNGLYRAYMQIDGNFVVYDTHSDPAGIFRPKWSSNTFGMGKRLVMRENGNMIVYDGNDNMMWATNTRGVGHFVKLENDGRLMMYNGRGIVWGSFNEA